MAPLFFNNIPGWNVVFSLHTFGHPDFLAFQTPDFGLGCPAPDTLLLLGTI